MQSISAASGAEFSIPPDGGYAQMMIAEARALASLPDKLETAAAAPLLCAGVTMSVRITEAHGGRLWATAIVIPRSRVRTGRMTVLAAPGTPYRGECRRAAGHSSLSEQRRRAGDEQARSVRLACCAYSEDQI